MIPFDGEIWQTNMQLKMKFLSNGNKIANCDFKLSQYFKIMTADFIDFVALLYSRIKFNNINLTNLLCTLI